MSQVFAILIIVPTVLALLLVAGYIVGAIMSFFGAGVDAAVIGIRHHLHPAQTTTRPTHTNRLAMHH